MPTILQNRYRIIRVIGNGGCGQTYLAADTQRFDDLCVIKQLRPLTDDPQTYEIIKQRFDREAAVLYDLGRTPGARIPKLQAYFSEGKEFYLVQDLIDGKNLAEKVDAEGPLASRQVEQIVGELLPVLDEIHSQGIIHRDIKPENIMMRSADGKLFLIDFGAVKEVVTTKLDARGAPTSSVIIGSPGFMPFEQVAGRPVFASDLYSLGLTAVYLLTGKRPEELIDAGGELDWKAQARALPPALETTLNKSLQILARDRFQTAREMFDALKADARRNRHTRRVQRPPAAEAPPAAPASAPPDGAEAGAAAETEAVTAVEATATAPRRAFYKSLALAALCILVAGAGVVAFVRYKNEAEARLRAAESRLAAETRAREAAEQAARDAAAAEQRSRQESKAKIDALVAAQPSLGLEEVTATHPYSQVGTRGVMIRIKYHALNLSDVNCKAAAYFYDEDGDALQSPYGGALTYTTYFMPASDDETAYLTQFFIADGSLNLSGTERTVTVKVVLSRRSAAESLAEQKVDFGWTSEEEEDESEY